MLDGKSYCAEAAGQSSVGMHVRHCLGFFDCFIAGLETGTVDYDTRERDPRIETDRQFALNRIAKLKDTLRKLPASDLPEELLAGEMPSPHSKSVPVPTCVSRELLFLASHSVHHLAMMLMIADLIGTSAPKELGLAFSTQVYREALEKDGH